MTGQFCCQTKGIVYCASCSKCRMQYVGQTGRRFYDRMMDHLRSIKNGTNAIDLHYKDTKCHHKDLFLQVIEKVMPDTEPLRLQRESYWINKLDTKFPHGMNKMS